MLGDSLNSCLLLDQVAKLLRLIQEKLTGRISIEIFSVLILKLHLIRKSKLNGRQLTKASLEKQRSILQTSHLQEEVTRRDLT